MTGTVTDPSNAVVVGATIKLVNVNTNGERTTTSNEAGIFTFPSIVPGVYKVSIEFTGFKSKTIENITISTFQQISLGSVALELGGGPSTVVEVTGEQLLVKDSAVKIQSIQSKMVEEMPIAGRYWYGLMRTIPGAAPQNTGTALNGSDLIYGNITDYKVNGKDVTMSQVNMDGGDITDHGNDQKTTIVPTLESIQEVAILTNNYTAEYGNKSGIVVNIISKSGSNTYHGTVFENLRNEFFNANSWNNNYQRPVTPAQPYRYNYFGANVGGPIKKNKLFFFDNFENFVQKSAGTTVTARYPTAGQINGDFSDYLDANGNPPSTIYYPGTQAAGAGVLFPSPDLRSYLAQQNQTVLKLGQNILKMFPAPNGYTGGGPTQNYRWVTPSARPRKSNLAKIDWNISDNTRLYGRLQMDGGATLAFQGAEVVGNFPQSLAQGKHPDYGLTLSLTKMIRPTLINETLFNWTKDISTLGLWGIYKDAQKLTMEGSGLGGLPTYFPVVPSSDGVAYIPRISNTGYDGSFGTPAFPYDAVGVEWQFADNVTWTRGKHIFKFGGQYIRNRRTQQNGTNSRGNYQFGVDTSSNFDTNFSPLNVLIGSMSSFSQSDVDSPSHTLYNDYNGFAQDTWKLKPNLTIDFGFRFYHTPMEYDPDYKANKDGVFLLSQWNSAQAPTLYVQSPTVKGATIDPRTGVAVPKNQANLLRYTIIPGSGSIFNGLLPLGTGAGTAGMSGLLTAPWLMIAPRGGVAYTFDQKTVLRAGFGWSYGRNGMGVSVNNFMGLVANRISISRTSEATITDANQLKVYSPQTVYARDETNNKLPVVYDFSAGVQRELPYKLIVELGYVGNLQRHNRVQFNLNAINPGVAWNPKYVTVNNVGNDFYSPIGSNGNTGTALPGTNTMDALVMRPYQGWNSINMNSSVGNARYHSMQFNVTKRYSHGLELNLSYTLAKEISSMANGVGNNYYYNWKKYGYGTAGSERHQVFVINYVYEIPKWTKRAHIANPVTERMFDGWQLSHMYQWVGGAPFGASITLQYAASDANGNSIGGLGNQSAIFMGTPDIGVRTQYLDNPGQLTRSQLSNQLDPSKLALWGYYPTYDGGGSTNVMRGMPTFSNDIVLTKIFKIMEGKTLELRLNAYNAFNQARGPQTPNSTLQMRANGAGFSSGFTNYNLPNQVLARQTSTDPRTRFTSYVGAFGVLNETSVNQMRIIELGVRFKF